MGMRRTLDTADLYRYFDCTNSGEFLYKYVEASILVERRVYQHLSLKSVEQEYQQALRAFEL